MINPTYPDIVDPQEGHSVRQIAIESLDSDSQVKVFNLSIILKLLAPFIRGATWKEKHNIQLTLR